MARRSSARLRERNASTPQRTLASQDDFPQVPRTAPSKLCAVRECDEMPGTFPDSPTDRTTKTTIKSNEPTTPICATPIKPSAEEMHPQLHHQSTVKQGEEARHLGFFKMIPQTEPIKTNKRLTTTNLQNTPTKIFNNANNVEISPSFKFTFHREHSLELSPEAKRMMNEKREEALRIREQMVASGESKTLLNENIGRKMATPVSKKSRFSDAHAADFNKMASIAGHASSFRAKPKTLSITTPAAQVQQAAKIRTSPMKRTHQDADLNSDSSASCIQSRSGTVKCNSTYSFPSVPTKEPSAHQTPDITTPSSKRVRLDTSDDVVTHKGTPVTTDRKLTAMRNCTPSSALRSAVPRSAHSQRNTILKRSPSKIGLMKTPIKSSVTSHIPVAKEASTLLSRSPAKASIFSSVAKPSGNIQIASPMLSQSPLKASPIKRPLFTGSSVIHSKSVSESNLLLKSPLKAATSKHIANTTNESQASSTPLLLQTPLKSTSLATNVFDASPSGKSGAGKVIGFTDLLRASPMKSILKSPQRLYSDDPAKVAAGTHLATPDKKPSTPTRNRTPFSTQKSKHVNFTSSTKGQDNKAIVTPLAPIQQNKPLVVDYPSLPALDEPPSPSPQKRRDTITPGDFTFRAGDHSIVFARSPVASPSAVKPSRTSTIRHVSVDSTVAPMLMSAKKRKYDFENEDATHIAAMHDDKENTAEETSNHDGERPSKRSKISTTPVASLPKPTTLSALAAKRVPDIRRPSQPVPSAATKRNPTLGVKPKGAKTVPTKDLKTRRPNTISQSRLAELSKPKQRV